MLAFLAGFLQATIVFVIEFTNLMLILVQTDPMDTVMNFIALAIIADFDNYVAESLRSDELI